VAALINSEEICISSLSQLVASEFIEDGSYSRHEEFLLEYYREKRDIMAEALSKITDFPIEYEIPEGGMSFWVKLPNEIGAGALLAASEKHGVGFMPGRLFYPEGEEDGNHIRLSFAQIPKSRIVKGVDLLHRAMKETKEEKI
jgi:DNA-binding transcriptional MocR family regulator